MARYAIGDIHGCYDQLQNLLSAFKFSEENDTLWFTGDLVNRGPKSLETIRFVKSLKNPPVVVLGNHDLHFLACAYGISQARRRKDTISDIIKAPDCLELCEWLRHQRLLHYDAELNFALVHAGIPPQWDINQALACAHELEAILQSEQHIEFYKMMYGNRPRKWKENLSGENRLRLITNYLARMRYCKKNGKLDLTANSIPGSQPYLYHPWFEIPDRKTKNIRILFGHWASLGGKLDDPNVIGLDTGCVWGNKLTAIRLEDGEVFSVEGYKPNS